MQRWCHGCGRQSTSPPSSIVTAFPMRSLRLSKLWWVGREGGAFRYIQWPLKAFFFLPRIGVSVKQQFTEEEIYKDRDSQITAIEKTFEDAQKSVIEALGLRGGRQTKVWFQRTLYSFSPCFCLCQISQHYSKPRVTPVEVMPVFPDFKVRSRAGGREG